MAVQFIRGTADMDLSEALLKSSVEWLAQDERNEVFYLVPNHMKFEQEIQSLKKIKQIQENGTAAVVATRFQVFSFYRLAWYYLQNTRYYSSDTVTEAGAAMIFRKILTENKEKLTMFQGEVDKAGFIQQLLDLYHETEEGTIELEQLLATLTQDGKEKDLVLKVADIQLLFTKYEEIISQYGVKSEKILDYLTAYSKEKDMAHVLFVVHGYQHFSARELKLIKVFMQQAGQIKISLLVDTKYPHEVPSLMKLFHETGSTYHQLYQLAQTSQIPILTDYVEHSHYLLSGTSMRQLVTYWQRAQDNKKTEEVVPLEEGTVNIWAAETIKEEIHHIAREIRRLVCEENYRYQDIQLLTREMDDYETVIDSVFSMHAIPYYLDRDMAMEQHPLVEFIQAFFDCQRYNYRYRDVLRLLRTELFFSYGEGAVS